MKNDILINKKETIFKQKIINAIKLNQQINDPKHNPSLARVIAEAQAQDVRGAVIKKAIESSKDKKEAQNEYILEIIGPGNTMILVEVMETKKTRAIFATGPALKKFGATLQNGTVATAFKKTGIAVVSKNQALADLDKAEEIAIMCDAVEEVEEIEDKEGNDSFFEFYCDASRLHIMRSELQKQKCDVKSGHIVFIPHRYATASKLAKATCLSLFKQLEEVPCVIAIHHNLDL